jgi:SAM-dependent methyltransferase
MSRDDRTRWDRQHAQISGAGRPASFLREIIDGDGWEIARGRALDVACGKGRNALFLADRGFDVVAIDISPVRLQEGERRAREKGLAISWQEADLESLDFPEKSFDLVINFNYLQRTLIPRLKSAVKHGGYLVFETFLIDQQSVGRPNNTAYLLCHNELLNFCRDFRVLFYREGKFSDGKEPSFRAQILAQKDF